MWDVAQGDLHYSPAWWHMLGYQEGEVAAHPRLWLEWLHPDDRGELETAIEALLHHVTPTAAAAFRLRHRDGSWVAVLANCVPTFGPDNDVVLLRGVNHLLTLSEPALRTVLGALAHSAQVRAQLETASELARVGYWETYPDGRPPYWAPVTYALVGVTREQGVNDHTFLDAVEPRDRKRVEALVSQAVASEVATHFKTELIGGRHGSRWVEVRGEPVHRLGELAFMRGVVIDIDDEQRTYLALQRSEAQLKTLGVYIPGVVFEYARSPGCPDRFNATHGDLDGLWGFAAEDVREDAGWAWARVDAADVASLRRALEISSAGSSPLDVVFRYHHPTRGIRWQHLEATCHNEPDSRVLWRGFCRDITEQRAAAETLESAYEHLTRANALLEAGGRLARMGTWEVRLDSGAVLWSAMTYAIHAVPPGDTVTLEMALQFYLPEWRPRVIELVDQAILQGQTFAHETPIRAYNGEVRWISSRGEPVYNEEGTIVALRGVIRDITDEYLRKELLVQQATTDSLTGLPNRSAFLSTVSERIQEANKRNMQVSVMMLDLDRFKEVNDTWGHDAGDRFLQAVANRLREGLLDGEFLARLGGDEFAIVTRPTLLGTPCDCDAEHVAQLLDAPFWPEGCEHRSSVSIGLACYPVHGETASELLRRADIAMFAAKADQGRTVVRFEPGLDARTQEETRLRTTLDRAIRAGQLRLAFQPKVSLQTARITGIEALLRWTDADGIEVSPSVFVPLAERTGLIHTLGAFVIEAAVEAACSLRDAGLSGIPIAINLSSRQFRNPSLVQTIRDCLARHEVPASALSVEITESLLMDDSQLTVEHLEALASMGISIALDDFGTGYSSFAYLQDMPLQELKIDQRFITGVEGNPRNARIVEAIVGVARALSLQTVAEGVETEATRDAVRRLGCDQFQGYLVTEPLPLAVLLPFLAASFVPEGGSAGSKSVGAGLRGPSGV